MTPETWARLLVVAAVRRRDGRPAAAGPPLPSGRRRLRIGAAAVALGLAGRLLAGRVGHALPGRPELVRFGELVVTYAVRVTLPPGCWRGGRRGGAGGAGLLGAYLADDDRYPTVRGAGLRLFTAAMLLVVVAGDLVLLLVGWEAMGICSYLLIAHDRRLPEPPARARRRSW